MAQFSDNFKHTLWVLKKYPWVILSALVATLFAIKLQNMDYYGNDFLQEQYERLEQFYLRNVLIGCLGISLFYAINIAIQRYQLNQLWSLIGVPIIAASYWLLHEDVEISLAIKSIILGITFHLLVSFIGFLKQGTEEPFWEYNKKLFISIVLTGIFTGVLVGGVMLAISGVDNLFGFHIESDFYLNIFSVLSIMGSVIIFLHFVKGGLHDLEVKENYPVILKFFALYVLIPLMIIYASILYVYMANIIVQWELPRGWVSMLVSAYSFFGILALLLVHPLKDVTDRSWVRIFSDVFYFSLIPLVILMGIGIYKRVSDYGITEPRYFIILLTIWILCIALYFIVNRNGKIRAIPISLAIFFIASILIPYWNVFDCSVRSQSKRFGNILIDHSLVNKENKIDYGAKIYDHHVNDLESILFFLHDRKELEQVREYFAEQDFETLLNKNKHAFRFRERFSDIVFMENSSLPNENVHISIALKSDEPNEDSAYIQHIDGYQYLISNVSHHNFKKIEWNQYSLEINPRYVDTQDFKFMFTLWEDKVKIDVIDLHPQISNYVAPYLSERRSDRILEEEILFEFELGDLEMRLSLDYLNYFIDRSSNPKEVCDFNGMLLIKDNN